MQHLKFVLNSVLPAIFTIAMIPCTALGQDSSGPDSADTEDSTPIDEHAQARMKLMLAAVQKYTVVLDGDSDKVAKVDPAGLLRWSNPRGDVADGMMAVYTTGPGERPAAISNIYVHGPKLNGLAMEAFADIHPGPIKLVRGSRKVWSPESRYSKFAILPDAPEPSDNPARRLVQIKRMADRFEIIDGFREPRSPPVPQTLRRMTRPTYRYGKPDGEIIDGALFTYVIATDPEACLVIEIHRKDGRTFWQYMALPMTIYSLDAKLDGNAVWTKPEAGVFGNPKAPFYTSRYRSNPGETQFRTLLPKP